MATGWIPPTWAFQLEREIMDPARKRLARAKQELADAEQAEAAAFAKFQRQYNDCLADDKSKKVCTMKSPFDDTDRTIICDCCGEEIDLAEANYAGPELPTWEGATLCNDCYATERVSQPQLVDPDQDMDKTSDVQKEPGYAGR